MGPSKPARRATRPGDEFANLVKGAVNIETGKESERLETEIVKRSDRVKGFVVQPRRWVVERTIAWLNRCRRLAKDWANLNRNALAFIKLASIRIMLRKLCNPT